MCEFCASEDVDERKPHNFGFTLVTRLPAHREHIENIYADALKYLAKKALQKSGLSACGIAETDASKAMLFSAQMVSLIGSSGPR